VYVRFWGTRGSIPKSGVNVLRYGGSTACVEVGTNAGTLLVIDCGTGAHGLGQELVASPGKSRSGHLLISHTHWDHIQGLPFFAPLFSPENRWDIYAPRGVRRSLQETLAGQMQSAYFPVSLEELGADIHYHELVEGTLQIGDVRVSTRYLNHPALTLGYRLQADGASLVYASDHEPHTRELATGRGHVTGEDLRHVEFLRGADLVIHDAQFTPEEYDRKVGWGHSTGEYAARVCQLAEARTLALTHHDPERHDSDIDLIVQGLAVGLAAESSLRVFAAAEGQVLTLVGRGEAPPAEQNAPPAKAEPAALLQQSVVIGAVDPTLAALLSEAVRADGFRATLSQSGQQAIDLVNAERPSLVLLEHSPGVIDGMAACRAVRRLPIEDARNLPIILLQTGRDDARDQEPCETERLEAPFSSAYLQARVRAWMLRQACRWQRAELAPGEEQRLAALHKLDILDTPSEERFDRLTRLAAAVFEVPIALITLVDRDRQWFKSRYGLELLETHRDLSFCAHAFLGNDVMVVPDTRLDGRFADNPVVTAEPHVRFYAGYPIRDAAGFCLGTLCLIDTRPRELDPVKFGLLGDIGSLVRREMCGC
jgi:phosphoribosyl 1,2-cyclic phosphodiesterase/DNA-binding response OmpR family regulator